MLHDSFLDQISGPIGRVVTSEESPATAHEFFFWTAESEAAQNLDIGHIVAAESEDATAVAVLDDPRRYSDLQSFLDDFYAYDGDPSLEALSERVEILVFKARVLATKHRDERKKSKRPVRTGPVHFATSRAIEFALGTEEFSGHSIPMLLHENGNEENGSPQRTPLYVDEEYLLGPEAGHLNITGMSGLSTKTSHALFTIASTFQTIKDKRVAALMFNVKGADLLFLDKPVEVSAEDDPELAERYAKVGQRGLPREDREMYESLGTEVNIVGGVHPKMNLEFFCELLQKIKQHRPGLHIKGFTAVELDYMFRKAKMNVEEGMKYLNDAGLDSLPGGGAEIFHPEIREQIADDKVDGKGWLYIHETAHKLGMHSNATMLYGQIEQYEHRIDHMRQLRALQDRS